MKEAAQPFERLALPAWAERALCIEGVDVVGAELLKEYVQWLDGGTVRALGAPSGVLVQRSGRERRKRDPIEPDMLFAWPSEVTGGRGMEVPKGPFAAGI